MRQARLATGRTPSEVLVSIVALRTVKDHISTVEGIMSVSINKQLLSSIQSVRQRYHCDLEAKRKQSEREQLKVNKEKEKS